MKLWDVFISHASEDKDEVAAPLAALLTRAGIRVWLDARQLRLGDSLRERIDEGLSKSRFGVVVLSPSFLKKKWPTSELNGLFAREIGGKKVILPIWHQTSQKDIADLSPMMADRLAIKTDRGLREVAAAIIDCVLQSCDESDDEIPQLVLKRLNKILDTEVKKSVLRDFLAYHHTILEHAVGITRSLSVTAELTPDVGGTCPDFVLVECSSTDGALGIHVVQLSTVGNLKVSSDGSPTGTLETDLGVLLAAFTWFKTNARCLRGGYVSELTGTVACGRRDILSEDQKHNLRKLNQSIEGIRVRSYDWLLDAAAAYLSTGTNERVAYHWSRLQEKKCFATSGHDLEW